MADSETCTLPTWRDVNVPPHVVNLIRRAKAGPALDRMVYELVYHCTRRVTYTYVCAGCRYSHTPNKITEDYPHCIRCGRKQLKCIGGWKNSADRISSYSSNIRAANELIGQMRSNIGLYTNQYTETGHFTCGVTASPHGFFAQFTSGTAATARSPAAAVAKAAILCPFLWDRKFNWSQEDPSYYEETALLYAPLINRLSPRKLRGF